MRSSINNLNTEQTNSADYRSESESNFSVGSSSSSTKRYFGNVTIEMIDDFLNPICKKKDKENRHQVKFVPSSCTNGMGIIENDEENNTEQNLISQSSTAGDAQSYLPFAARDSKKNFDYVQHNKKSYEQELKNSSLINTNAMCESILNQNQNEERSVVGSAMSQMESVSSMNLPPSRKLQLMKETKRLAALYMEEGASVVGDDNNNYDMSKINAMMEHAKAAEEEEKIKREKHLEELCKHYTLRKNFDKTLPITQKREHIIHTIDSYPFCIIQGSTGCGKTTQVPQYILDAHMQKKKYCNIIVTQPRRIAAISVAKRVCNERGWSLGGLCGYQIGLDRNHVSEDTRITYVTTGVLLQKLIGPHAEENFEKYTHIILDEVHERDLDTDFVLLVIKIKSYKNLSSKILLMSATIESDLFAKYYAAQLKSNLNPFKSNKEEKLRLAPTLNVEANVYNVQEYYWDDLVTPNSFLSNTIISSFKTKLKSISKNDGMFTSQSEKNFYSLYQRSYENAFRSNNSNVRLIDNNKSGSGVNDKPNSVKMYKQHMQEYSFSFEEPSMSEEAMFMAINLLRFIDEEEMCNFRALNEMRDNDEDLNGDDDESNVTTAATSRNQIIDDFLEHRGSVLIFVPGMNEIQQLQEMITHELSDSKLNLLPLHSDIIVEQQVRVFDKPEPTIRKVIISTSIAESSITVSDIKYVIDFCLTKELYCDPMTNYTHLRMEWASKSSLNQRRGRAGRVSDGVCYRLISKIFFEDLEAQTKPAILREPLSSLILNVKRLKQTGEPKKILSLAIQPPKLSDIERTVLTLKEVGALTLKCKNSLDISTNNPYDGDLTYVGSIMANLPIDVRLSKLILLGHAFGKLREAIIIAAGLSTKTFFTCYFKSYLESFRAKWVWSEGWMCDCISILNVFNLYESNLERGVFTSQKSIRDWAKGNMIEIDRLREVVRLKSELENRLLQFNIKCNRDAMHYMRKEPNYSSNKQNNPYDIDDTDDRIRQTLILKMILAGAFYPNYFNAQKLEIQEAYKLVSFKDIRNTVQIKNLPSNEGILYYQKLCDIFRVCCNSLQLHFDDTRAVVEFKSQFAQVPSNVNLGVYLAVQMRLLRLPMRLKRFTSVITQERLKKIEQAKNMSGNLSITVDKNMAGVLKLNISSIDLNSSSSSLNNSSNLKKRLTKSEKSLNKSYAAGVLAGTRPTTSSRVIDEDSDTETETENNNSVSLHHHNSTLTLVCDDANDSEDERHNDFMLGNIGSSSRNNNAMNTSKLMSCASLLNCNDASFIQKNGSVFGDISLNSNLTLNSSFSMNNSKMYQSRILTSNRIQPGVNSIVEYLSNPMYLLPENVDRGELIDVCMSDYLECGHFWAQIHDEAHINTLNEIQAILNNKNAGNRLKLLNQHNIKVNEMCVTAYKDVSSETLLYRALILSVDSENKMVEVMFVDFGNKEKKSYKELFEMSSELQEYPFQAIECKLANIKMSVVKNPKGTWSSGATQKFKSILAKNDPLKMKVIGLDGNIVMITLARELDNELYDVGEQLVTYGYSESVDLNQLKSNKQLQMSETNLFNSRILYMPTRESDYTNKKPAITNVTNPEVAQMLYRSKLNTNPKFYSVGKDLDKEFPMISSASGDHNKKSKNQNNAGSDDEEDTISSIADSFNTDTTNQGLTDDQMNESCYSGFIELNGPYSPLEVNYFSIVNNGHRKRTRVERNSINYVTLDDDPFNECTRLMIASDVTLNAPGDTMIMRKTCLMPKLPGLSNICCLLYSPNVEFRVSDDKSRLIGALCGLGFDNDGAIYTDNDIESVFDVNIDLNDISMINAVRLAINLIIGSEEAVQTWTHNEANLRQLQQKACEKLLQVIQRKRTIIEPTYFHRPYRWNQINNQDLMSVMPEETENSTSDYYSYHKGVILGNPNLR